MEAETYRERCVSYARRLDQLNKDFNKLWDYLISIGHDPEKALASSAPEKRPEGRD